MFDDLNNRLFLCGKRPSSLPSRAAGDVGSSFGTGANGLPHAVTFAALLALFVTWSKLCVGAGASRQTSVIHACRKSQIWVYIDLITIRSTIHLCLSQHNRVQTLPQLVRVLQVLPVLPVLGIEVFFLVWWPLCRCEDTIRLERHEQLLGRIRFVTSGSAW